MEFGAYQLQIFTSLVVILGAAFVALICDFLKGNNEQLRELTIELKVRREEEQRRSQTMLPHAMKAAAASTAAPVAASAAAAQAKLEQEPAARPMAAHRERKRMP